MVATCSVSAVPIPVADGGTGAVTLTSGGVLIGAGTSAVSATLTPSGLTSVTATSHITSSATIGTTFTDNSIAVTGSTANTDLILAGKGTGGVIQSRGLVAGDLTIEVTNTDNTNGASRAGFEAAVGGATAGDPYVNFLVSGAGSFTMGIDNSASDNFVLSTGTALGTTDNLTIASTGATTINRGALTVTTGGITATAGAITATNGNVIMSTAGNGIQVKEGTNARMGQSTLTNGTVTVSNTSVTANTRIFLSRQSIGTTGANPVGMLVVGTVSAATSFVINAVTTAVANTLVTTDQSIINWLLIEPAT